MQGDLKAIGQLRLSGPDRKRTGGGFARLVMANRAVFDRYSGRIHPGSLNVEIGDPLALTALLDQLVLPPALVIPRDALTGQPRYIGDARVWRAQLTLEPAPTPIACWVFRHLGSMVPMGMIELLARDFLRDHHALQDRDPVGVIIHAGAADTGRRNASTGGAA